MIDFNIPVIMPKAKKYLKTTLKVNKYSGDGIYNQKSIELLQSICKNKNVITTSSCSHSLEIALMLLNLRERDEIIIPDWTFTSVANAVLTQGGTPVFLDCNLNPPLLTFNDIKTKITDNTKAVILVNYNGFILDLDEIEKYCVENKIYLIQDSAHSINSNFNDLPANNYGFASTYSFHETKNIQCGEGGALIINDDEKFEQAIQIKDKGTNRKKFIEGKVEKYQWVRKGSSYLLAEPLAAILTANLEKNYAIHKKRMKIWQFYQNELKNLPEQYGMQVPIVPKYSNNAFHIFYLIFSKTSDRSSYIKYMKEKDINVVFHYQSLSSSLAGSKFNKNLEEFPNSKKLSNTLIRLPLHLKLKKSESYRIVDETFNFIKKFM